MKPAPLYTESCPMPEAVCSGCGRVFASHERGYRDAAGQVQCSICHYAPRPRVTLGTCERCGAAIVVSLVKEGRREWFIARCPRDRRHYTRRWRQLLAAIRFYASEAAGRAAKPQQQEPTR